MQQNMNQSDFCHLNSWEGGGRQIDATGECVQKSKKILNQVAFDGITNGHRSSRQPTSCT